MKVTLAQLINEDFGYALPDIDRDVAVRCPWHKDSGLSLSVNPVRGTYRCSSCAMNGDIATYLVVVRKIPLTTAVSIAKTNSPKTPALERPGDAVIRLFRNRARNSARNTMGLILGMPIYRDRPAPMIYEGLLPTAPQPLAAEVKSLGLETDWDHVSLNVSTPVPKRMKLRLKSRKLTLAIDRVAQLLPGAHLVKKDEAKFWRVPLKSLGSGKWLSRTPIEGEAPDRPLP